MSNPTILLTKEFTFDAAHQLDWHGGKCKNLHGHTYRLQVTVTGKLDNNGIICDFGALKKIVTDKIISLIDHHYLNEIIKNPTAEIMAAWMWKQLKKDLNLVEIKIWETPTSCVIYKE